MTKVLAKRFIVVSDPYSSQNDASFGVVMTALTPDRKELRRYFHGTGNCLIGGVCTAEYHGKRAGDLNRMLADTLRIFDGELKAAEVTVAVVKNVDAEKQTLTLTRAGVGSHHYGVDLAKGPKELEFQLDPDTRVVDGLSQLKETIPLKDGVKSELLAPGAEVTIASTTDKDGKVKVSEVRILRKPRRGQ